LLQEHLVRLACIRHAASVHPEPGSNSPQKHPLRDERYGRINWLFTSLLSSYHFSVVKVQRHCFVKPIQTKAPMLLSTSARQTAIHQACVSDLRLILSCQRSVWGDEICFRLHWRMVIICFSFTLSRENWHLLGNSTLKYRALFFILDCGILPYESLL
jgi:hypothetical protein